MSLQDEEERDRYERHMVVWTEYYGWMKDRADEIINIIETANRVATNTIANVILPPSPQPGTSHGSVNTGVLGRTQIISTVPDGTIDEFVGDEHTGVGEDTRDHVEATETTTGVGVREVTHAADEPSTGGISGVTSGRGHHVSTNLALAIASADHLADTLEKDIKTVEEEVSLGGTALNESYVLELKTFCSEIQG